MDALRLVDFYNKSPHLHERHPTFQHYFNHKCQQEKDKDTRGRRKFSETRTYASTSRAFPTPSQTPSSPHLTQTPHSSRPPTNVETPQSRASRNILRSPTRSDPDRSRSTFQNLQDNLRIRRAQKNSNMIAELL